MNYKYNNVVLGGTFDLLHLGHQSFLSKAFKLAKFVTIGITSDKFNNLRGKPAFENQNLRLKNLKAFLTKQNFIERSKIVFINDVFGTTLKDPKLEAIVVTSKTKKVVDLINKKRVNKNLNKLDIIAVPFIRDQKGQIISSTRIREGQISTSGQSYRDLLLKIAGIKLSETVRAQLRKPLGSLTSLTSPDHLATLRGRSGPNLPYLSIGDVTTANLLKARLSPKLAIVDAKVGRRPALSSLKADIKVNNPPGQISKSLILAISRTLELKGNQVIQVLGEEDLATIPAILLAPLGTTVYYGQPKKGLVKVKVDLEIKDYLCQILSLR